MKDKLMYIGELIDVSHTLGSTFMNGVFVIYFIDSFGGHYIPSDKVFSIYEREGRKVTIDDFKVVDNDRLIAVGT